MGTAAGGWRIPVGWEFPTQRPHPWESAEFWVLRDWFRELWEIPCEIPREIPCEISTFCVCSPPERWIQVFHCSIKFSFTLFCSQKAAPFFLFFFKNQKIPSISLLN